MKIDGYIRVSRVGGREGESFISPELQREKIEAWAKLRDVEIGRWHTDLDQTGGKLDRPGLNAVMARIKSGQTSGIAVARLDRLSRAGVADALKLVQDIHDHGGTIAAVDLGIDPATEFGEFGMTIMLALGRMERRRIARTWQESREKANARGVYRVRAPFGYTRNDSGRLKVNADAVWVRGMYERKAQGDTLATIARWLNDSGVKPPSADDDRPNDKRARSRQWVRTTVKDLLTNRAYLGIAYDGPYENVNAHEAIVDKALFEAAKGKAIMPSQSPNRPNLLAGLVRCAGCGYTMPTGRSGSPENRVRSYYCKKRNGAGTCECPAAIQAQRLEPWIVDSFFLYIANPVFEPSVESVDYEALTVAYEKAHAELDSFVEDVEARDLMGRDVWLKGVQSRKDAVTLAKRAVEEARADATGIELPPVADLRRMWDSLPVGSQQRYLSLAIDAIMVRSVGRGAGKTVAVAERARILWRGQAPDDLPRRGRTNVMRPFVFAPDFPPVDAGVPAGEVAPEGVGNGTRS